MLLCSLLVPATPCLSQDIIDLNQVWGDIRVNGAERYDRAGRSLASADVNADGLLDLIIGAVYSHGNDNPGKVFVLFGREEFPSTINFAATPADMTVKGWNREQPGTGMNLAHGDVNADGIEDIVIGNFLLNEAYVVFGNAVLPPVIDLALTPADLTVYGHDTLGYGGLNVSSGDMNGDGISDLLVAEAGAHMLGRPNAGAVHVFYGRPDLPATIDLKVETSDFTLIGGAPKCQVGYSLGSGDVNGDGISDLLAYGSKPRAVYVIYGGVDLPEFIDLAITPADMTIGVEDEARYGAVSLCTGDVNGDGVGDLLIGVPRHGPGRTYLMYGRNNFPPYVDLTTDPADVVILGKEDASDDPFNQPPLFGFSVTTGDYSGDGIADIFVGAPRADAPERRDTGKAYMLYGGDSLPAVIDLAVTNADISVWGDGGWDGTGMSVLITDLNGDGGNDIMVGAPQVDLVLEGGMVYVIYGKSPFGVSPKGFKRHALMLLADVHSRDRHAMKQIRAITEYVKRSLNEHPRRDGHQWKRFPLWTDGSHLDEKHGHMVFDEEKKAARELVKLRDDPGGGLPVGFCGRVIDLLIEADSTLAATAIKEAKDAGGNEEELARAEKEMTDARRDLIKDGYTRAIDHYKSAWRHALRAIKKKADGNMQTALPRMRDSGISRLTLMPNPFSTSTEIRYSLPFECDITLSVHDATGRLMGTIADQRQGPGVFQARWDARGHTDGVYFCRLRAGDFVETRKMVLVR